MLQREILIWGSSANTETFVRQRGEPGQALVPIPPLKQTNIRKYNFIIIWPHCIGKVRSQEKKKKTRRARRPQEGRKVTLVIWPRGHLSSYTFGLIGMTMEASGLVKGYSQTTLTKIWSPTYPRLTLVKDFLYWHTVDISSTYHLPASSRQPSWSRQRSLWMSH